MGAGRHEVAVPSKARDRAKLYTFAIPGLLVATGAGALEIHGAFSVAPQIVTEDRNSPAYGLSDTPRRSGRNDLELKLQEGGFNAQGILRQTVAEGQRPGYHGIANQFYYDGQITPGLGWTVGRKVMPWGVGFGFKPLDVVQREDRRGVNLPPLVGVPLVALERYTATDAWTLAWTRPGENQGESDYRDPGLALRWYRLAGSDDLHGVLRISQRRRLEAGFGATRVIGEEWSLYGAALYQARGPVRPDGSFDGAGVKALAGLQWTGESGISVLAEAWHDADAINVPRGNLLLRLAWDDRDGFKPYAEMLLTPGDGGRVYTAGAAREGNRNRIALGLRQFGGAADSAYGRSPTWRVLWAEWRLALF
jgi:hypothetical protein